MKLPLWLSRLFKKKDHNKQWRLRIIDLVNRIKDAVENPTVSMIIKITKTKADDTAQAFLINILSDVLATLDLSKRISPEARLKNAIDSIAEMDSNKRSGAYKNIAGHLYNAVSSVGIETATVAMQTEYNSVPVIDKPKGDFQVICWLLVGLILISLMGACTSGVRKVEIVNNTIKLDTARLQKEARDLMFKAVVFALDSHDRKKSEEYIRRSMVKTDSIYLTK